MALKPKDSAVQFRIETDVLEKFQARCDYYGLTVSAALRSAIRSMIHHHEEDLRRAEVKASPGGANVKKNG